MYMYVHYNYIMFCIIDNFNHNDDGEITLQGFLDLHELTANDQDGGEPELWNILHSMGYNRRLQLTQV